MQCNLEHLKNVFRKERCHSKLSLSTTIRCFQCMGLCICQSLSASPVRQFVHGLRHFERLHTHSENGRKWYAPYKPFRLQLTGLTGQSVWQMKTTWKRLPITGPWNNPTWIAPQQLNEPTFVSGWKRWLVKIRWRCSWAWRARQRNWTQWQPGFYTV